MSRKAPLILFLLLVLTFSLSRAWGANMAGGITGIVTNASGMPAPGAMIKARNTDRGMTVAVFSQAQGRYSIPNLLPGTYVVQAVGGGFQSDLKAAVTIGETQTVTANLVLTLRQHFQTVSSSQAAENRTLPKFYMHKNPEEGLTSAQFAQWIPDEKWRETLMENCGHCHHALERIVPRRASLDEWKISIGKMSFNPYGYFESANMTNQERDEIAAYLAKNFGPTTPPPDLDRYISKTWVTGEAAKAVITEYDLQPGALAHDVAVDSQGIGWVDEGTHGMLGALDPRTQTYTRIPIPPGEPSLPGINANAQGRATDDHSHVLDKPYPTALCIDPQDRLWFEDRLAHRLVLYDPRTQTFKSWPFPRRPPRLTTHVNMIRFLRDGTVWMPQIGGNQVLKFDPATEKFSEYLVPSAKLGNVQVYGMAIDGNQKPWFTEFNLSNKVGAVDPQSGEITEIDLPTPGAHPKRPATDAQGNVWVPEYGGVGKLAMIDYRTGKITEYPAPTKYSGPYSADVDKKHNLIWVNEMHADAIARFDPRTKTWVEYPLPGRYYSIRRIEVDPNHPTRVWYVAFATDKVGYIEVSQ